MTAMNRASSYANRNCFPHMTISFDGTFALLHHKINYPDPKSAVDANYQARSSLIYLQLTVKGKTIFRHFCCLIKKMMNADFVRATRKIFLFCKQIGNAKENFHVVVTWSHKKEEKKLERRGNDRVNEGVNSSYIWEHLKCLVLSFVAPRKVEEFFENHRFEIRKVELCYEAGSTGKHCGIPSICWNIFGISYRGCEPLWSLNINWTFPKDYRLRSKWVIAQ